ncbi:tyrosine-type recombinase/integrase [Vibrio sp. JC009]|uniref:tyrosine-type recombinase/integrase n=1 Tax=Vibrio sp. JC009 TaxID=2912314 RepID=UPI0023AE8B2B|nr:tyrosine-type recombinase/integrase [Vibrio sp. JC009]WED22681.1 tyrosine-type recombinase/integrase [Vibrio sp. JC009]
MAKKCFDEKDSLIRSLERYEADANEAATETLDSLERLFDAESDIGFHGSLVARLNEAPDGSFYITDKSKYSSNSWVLPIQQSNIVFNSDITGANALFRALAYYLTPDFNPFGRITSYNSTRTYTSCFPYLEKFLFLPNALGCEASDLNVITPRLLNEALDRAKEHSARAYSFTYFLICFWISISDQKLLPSVHTLSVSLKKIRTKERYQDIQAAIAKERVGWKPLSEEELELLVEHALFWSEKALPEMLRIASYLDEIGASTQKHKAYMRRTRDTKLEQLLGTKIDGVVICGFNYRVRELEQQQGRYVYEHHSYSWRRSFKLAVDKILESIIILLSLITGMRNREMGILKFEDITKSEDGENWILNITRFKTGSDPNYFGEHDYIPLPDFIGEIISDYKTLREFVEQFSVKRELLLTTVHDSREESEKTDTARGIRRTLSRIGESLGIDDSLHHHRFRKTIAEILIKRSERNIDLIRMLFGHKSYRMSLKYIARNPYLIESVVDALSEHYTEDFIHIVNSVRKGGYSGEAAGRIAAMTQDAYEFKGTLIRMSVRRYIAYLLEAGEPIFIKRTTLGTYCVSTDKYSESHRPPCISHIGNGESASPDVSNCQLDCKNAVILEDAKDALESNIRFYEQMLSEGLSEKARKYFKLQLQANQKHLSKLNTTGCVSQTEVSEASS